MRNNSDKLLVSTGGLQWESMGIKASRSGTGFSMVSWTESSFSTFPTLYFHAERLPLPSEFRYGKAPILIATDVASRGLG